MPLLNLSDLSMLLFLSVQELNLVFENTKSGYNFSSLQLAGIMPEQHYINFINLFCDLFIMSDLKKVIELSIFG